MEVIPYIFSSSLALLSSLLSCSFYFLDQRTISGVDILEMMWKDGSRTLSLLRPPSRLIENKVCTVNKRSSLTANVYGQTILKKCR